MKRKKTTFGEALRQLARNKAKKAREAKPPEAPPAPPPAAAPIVVARRPQPTKEERFALMRQVALNIRNSQR